MTMDVGNNRKIELKSDIQTQCDDQTPIKVVKRPFDVAFLMLPDDKLKQKQTKQIKTQETVSPYNNNDDEEDEEIEVGTNSDFIQKNHHKYFTQKQQIFDDPNLLMKTKNLDELRGKAPPEQKSAFTKVNLAKETQRLSPNLSISPDLSYQNSLSPSPPIRTSYPNMLFKNQQVQAYQNTSTFLPEAFASSTDPFLMKNPQELIHQQRMRPVYRPEMAYNYQQFPNQADMLKLAGGAAPADIRGPAAAILSSLLPPSLAALSLPAQNVCAKCNISFRMTSDLVYHMRSHHKNDSMDMHKRRREEKLKCPVCAESFRERHHLTRHMTAHQDKEEDEGNVKKKCLPAN